MSSNTLQPPSRQPNLLVDTHTYLGHTYLLDNTPSHRYVTPSHAISSVWHSITRHVVVPPSRLEMARLQSM